MGQIQEQSSGCGGVTYWAGRLQREITKAGDSGLKSRKGENCGEIPIKNMMPSLNRKFILLQMGVKAQTLHWLLYAWP